MRVQPVGAAGGLARLQRAKALADFAVLDAALHRQQGLRRVIAQRGRKRDLFLGGAPRRGQHRARRTSPATVPRGARPWPVALRFGRFGHDAPASTSRNCRRRESPSAAPRAASGSSVAGSCVPEYERAGDRPFAGFRRALENEGVRRVEPDGSRQFQHVRLIRVSDRAPGGSYQRNACQRVDQAGPLRRRRLAAGTHQEIAVDVDGPDLAGFAPLESRSR